MSPWPPHVVLTLTSRISPDSTWDTPRSSWACTSSHILGACKKTPVTLLQIQLAVPLLRCVGNITFCVKCRPAHD